MKNIYQSATKIVLILMTIALIGLTAYKIIDAKDFIVITSMVFTYYFTKAQGVKEAKIEAGVVDEEPNSIPEIRLIDNS